jgi:Putative transmembrane protein (PGPGW)
MARVARAIAGFALLLAGAAMLVLPGPGWAAIALGLALLAPDFPWAHRALERLKATGREGASLAREWWRRLRTRSSASDDGRVG